MNKTCEVECANCGNHFVLEVEEGQDLSLGELFGMCPECGEEADHFIVS